LACAQITQLFQILFYGSRDVEAKYAGLGAGARFGPLMAKGVVDVAAVKVTVQSKTLKVEGSGLSLNW